MGGLQDFSVGPIPLGTNWVFELVGTCGKFEDDQSVCDMDGGSLRGET